MHLRMLALVMNLEGKKGTEYQISLATQILMLSWIERSGHPLKDMVNSDVNCLNEERGELSFSVLARSLTGNPLRSDIDKVSRMYKLTRLQMKTAKEFKVNHDGDEKEVKNFRRTIDVNGDDLKTTVAHFKHVIRSMKHGTWVHYNLKAKKIKKASVMQATAPTEA